MALKKKKTWSEKFNARTIPEITSTERKFADIPEGAMMLIATPAIIEAYIKEIPAHETRSIADIRKDLAEEYEAEYTCPVTTGIFLRIVAEKNYEQYEKGTPLKDIAPFWRVIDAKSPTAKKLTFETSFLEKAKQELG